jgi:hypothetical protein
MVKGGTKMNYTVEQKIAIYEKAKQFYLEFGVTDYEKKGIPTGLPIGLCYCIISAVKILHNQYLCNHDIWHDKTWSEFMSHKPEGILDWFDFWWDEHDYIKRLGVLDAIINELKNKLKNEQTSSTTVSQN